MSVKYVAESIVKAFEFKGECTARISLFLSFSDPAEFHSQFDTTKSDGQLRKPASNEKLLSLIGDDFQFTPFEQGIYIYRPFFFRLLEITLFLALDATVKWFTENYETARTGIGKEGKEKKA